MSVRKMAEVWEFSQHSGTHLLLLLAIADFADDNGRAYPSVASLARKCRMKPRNAQTLLASLRESGELVIRNGEGPKGTNLYRIQPLQKLAPLQDSAPLQGIARGGAKACANPLQGIAPKPSMNHQEPLNIRPLQDSAPLQKTARFNAADYLVSRGVDSQVISDWLELRKAKRAAVTQTTVAGIEREAEKAGMTLAAALAICCERGWQGFNADWMVKRQLTAARGCRTPAPDNFDGRNYGKGGKL